MLAFYSRPYKVVDYDQFAIMTELAGYYCALPIFSVSLSGAFSSRFIKEIPVKAVELLPLAAQLHHAILFRECMIHIVGRWSDPRVESIRDVKLRKLAEAARNTISSKIVLAHSRLMLEVGETQVNSYLPVTKTCSPFNVMYSNIAADVYKINKQSFSLPIFYRRLSLSSSIRSVAALLKNELVLDPDVGLESAGATGKYLHYFLCATVDDEDLPWDINATDF